MYVIYTDGACSGNPGPGGWGVVIKHSNQTKTLSGFEANTTNNRMELLAAIEALSYLEPESEVALFTDSQYVRQGMTSWLGNWKANNWQNSQKKPVKNKDLWQRLDQLATKCHVQWHWVKAHNGHPENELADSLARKAITENVA